MSDLVVDIIAQKPWQIVLVEQGPWLDIEAGLKQLQDRLYGCLDAALDGQLADKFPASSGQEITLRVDCYDLPQEQIEPFFTRFSAGVLTTPEYASALANSPHVAGVEFTINFG